EDPRGGPGIRLGFGLLLQDAAVEHQYVQLAAEIEAYRLLWSFDYRHSTAVQRIVLMHNAGNHRLPFRPDLCNQDHVRAFIPVVEIKGSVFGKDRGSKGAEI